MGKLNDTKPLVIVMTGEAMNEQVVRLDSVERDGDGAIIYDVSDEQFQGIAGDVIPNMVTYLSYTLQQVAPDVPVELRVVTGASEREGDTVKAYFEAFKEGLAAYNPNITVNSDFIVSMDRDVSEYTIFEKDGARVDYLEPEGERSTRFKMTGRLEGAGSVMLNDLDMKAALEGADVVITSEVLQAVTKDREQFVKLHEAAGEAGVKVLHSTNLRANMWEEAEGKANWKAAAQTWGEKGIVSLPEGSMVATSLDDEKKLYGDGETPKSVSERVARLNEGVAEIVVTNGIDKGAVFIKGMDGALVKAADVVPELAPKELAIDDTGAGDSFMAAYVALRQAMPDLPIQAAANVAVKVPKEVVQQKGGNIPLEDLPEIDFPKREARGGVGNRSL